MICLCVQDAAARQPDRKRDSEQMAAGSPDNQPAAANSTDEMADETQTGTYLLLQMKRLAWCQFKVFYIVKYNKARP